MREQQHSSERSLVERRRPSDDDDGARVYDVLYTSSSLTCSLRYSARVSGSTKACEKRKEKNIQCGTNNKKSSLSLSRVFKESDGV